MKPILVKILIGVAGFAGGFASGFLVHKKINNLQFEEISMEEMAAIENKVASTEKKEDIPVVESPASQVDINAPLQDEKLPETADDIQQTIQGKKPFIEADAESKTAYEKLWKATKSYSDEDNANQIPVWMNKAVTEEANEADAKGTDEDIPEDEIEEEDAFIERLEMEAEAAANSFVDPPHQIDLAEFYNGRPDYDKITIHWYEPDNVWIDETDDKEKIKDITSYTGDIGNPFLVEGMDDDPDVRFIRNDHYGTDYEVIRHHRSYQETTGE